MTSLINELGQWRGNDCWIVSPSSRNYVFCNNDLIRLIYSKKKRTRIDRLMDEFHLFSHHIDWPCFGAEGKTKKQMALHNVSPISFSSTSQEIDSFPSLFFWRSRWEKLLLVIDRLNNKTWDQHQIFIRRRMNFLTPQGKLKNRTDKST